MVFIDFPEANRKLGAPVGMTAEEVGTLPVYADGQQCISCWQPTEQEREAIAAGLPIYLGVLVSSNPAKPAFTQPPVFATVGKPHMPPVVHKLTTEVDGALQQFAKRLPDTAFAGGRPQTGRELVAADPHLRQYADNDDLYPEQLYFVSSEAIQAEHLANMRQAYQEHGQPAVVAYLKPYKAFLGQPDAQAAH
jgi:hypothetical protein